MQKLHFQKDLRSLFLAALLPAALVVISACDDTETSTAQPPQLAQASNWIEVFERRTCINLVAGQTCLGQTGFHVDADGRVAMGPENGPVETMQTITAEEQNAVINAANAVAAENLSSLNLKCELWTPGPNENGAILKLRDDTQTLRTVYQKSLNTMQKCYRGDKALAEALFNATDPLIDKYGITPSPTPSVTTSPTPSVSPSMSPTPSPSPSASVSPTPSPSLTMMPQ
jgi:hypothetical protein